MWNGAEKERERWLPKEIMSFSLDMDKVAFVTLFLEHKVFSPLFQGKTLKVTVVRRVFGVKKAQVILDVAQQLRLVTIEKEKVYPTSLLGDIYATREWYLLAIHHILQTSWALSDQFSAVLLEALGARADVLFNMIVENVAIKPGSSILDVGAGHTALCESFINKFPLISYTMLDMPHRVPFLKGKCPKENTEIIAHDILSKPLNRQWSLILLVSFLHIYPRNIGTVLGHLFQMLCAGGKVVVVDIFADRFNFGQTRYGWRLLHDRDYSVLLWEDMIQATEQIGLVLEHSKDYTLNSLAVFSKEKAL